MKVLWRWLVPIIGVTVLLVPGAIFFGQRGADFLAGRDLHSATLAIFPLVGLYAFTLLWIQLMLGSLMPWWRRMYPGIERWHRTQGVFVFLLALLHPSLLLIGIGLAPFATFRFVDQRMIPFVLLGETALLLMTVTVLTALLRKTARVKRWWRQIHLLNYLIFILVWFHSWNLGSDVQSSNLRWLWLGFGISAVGAILLRVFGLTWPRRQTDAQPTARLATEPSRPRPVMAAASAGGSNFEPVARVDQVKDGQPFCADLRGQKIMIVRRGDQWYALDNVCSHAGGPLCEGTLEGKLIECPWHFSRFDITTGAVVEGPASQPQKTYRVRVSGQQVEVAA